MEMSSDISLICYKCADNRIVRDQILELLSNNELLVRVNIFD